MKITKRQLRRIIRESCGLDTPAVAEVPLQMQLPSSEVTESVPVPADYDAVRGILEQNPDMVDLAIKIVMKAAGTSCERSSAQAIIDHLQDMLVPQAEPEGLAGLSGFIKGPGF